MPKLAKQSALRQGYHLCSGDFLSKGIFCLCKLGTLVARYWSTLSQIKKTKSTYFLNMV
jgi:hypothetical protein